MGLEAIASRLEAIASRLEAIAVGGWRPLLLGSLLLKEECLLDIDRQDVQFSKYVAKAICRIVDPARRGFICTLHSIHLPKIEPFSF